MDESDHPYLYLATERPPHRPSERRKANGGHLPVRLRQLGERGPGRLEGIR